MNRLDAKLPTPEEVALSKASSRELSAFLATGASVQKVAITDPKGKDHVVSLPVSALRLLVDILTELGDGNTVQLVPVHAELTTQEAADLLNMSRPTLVKLLDEGAIPYTQVGNRRKVRYADVRTYQAALRAKRLEALESLSQIDQELGLGYK
ncbi:excisionase family DNA binding protein [Litorivivens lipolytica]|uniref:Excisionase family DNA binding protein n=1 Tax=Litorivivens lipolytica TaxID=1524264 RepID=A0A7W4W7L5_9GAMM|nr:helix-turn-helix domain-containing protein [Litorivivens lipolytica]MBB3048966.1 excisionase family DNA binding protein [Litorivivens lipolytica]